jgi:hypothetical protein
MSTRSLQSIPSEKAFRPLCSPIPSQLNDGPKDEVCRSPDQARDGVEINAHLGTNHGNKKQQSDQDHHSVRFKVGERVGQKLGKEADGNPTTIKRRQRQHIEYGQNNISPWTDGR